MEVQAFELTIPYGADQTVAFQCSAMSRTTVYTNKPIVAINGVRYVIEFWMELRNDNEWHNVAREPIRRVTQTDRELSWYDKLPTDLARETTREIENNLAWQLTTVDLTRANQLQVQDNIKRLKLKITELQKQIADHESEITEWKAKVLPAQEAR